LRETTLSGSHTLQQTLQQAMLLARMELQQQHTGMLALQETAHMHVF
jgi:hypothetical protein